MKRKTCHDSEWFKAESTGKKHYFWVEMYNGGRTIKLYTQALADLWTKRTGLHARLIQIKQEGDVFW